MAEHAANQRKKAATFAVLAVIGIFLLALLLARSFPPPKARSTRISGVNNMRTVTLTLPSTNAVASPAPAAGK